MTKRWDLCQTFSYADGMSSYLNAQRIRIFDDLRFAQPLRDQVREGTEKLAAKAGIEIESQLAGTPAG